MNDTPNLASTEFDVSVAFDALVPEVSKERSAPAWRVYGLETSGKESDVVFGVMVIAEELVVVD